MTLGTIHIPHTEDIPIVLTQGVQLTFHILPYNYFDEDMSLSSRDNVRVTPGKDGTMVYKYSGIAQNDDTCSARVSAVTSDVTSYHQVSVGLVMCLIFGVSGVICVN